MYRLMVLADDFTGALDTGVRFAGLGVKTLVTGEYRSSEDFEAPPQVLVLNLESRHLKLEAARKLVREISQKDGAEYYYKKTDSGMRGNIGAELEGLLREGEVLAFVPAFPEAGRTTVNGVHYSDGVPVSRTVFGKDPFEPVTHDYIPDIIAEQSDARVHIITHDSLDNLDNILKKDGILLFDAADGPQMDDAAKAVEKLGPPRLMAGCSGFARYLPQMLGLETRAVEIKKIPPMLAVLSGSINGLTLNQISFASKAGFEVIELSPEEKLSGDLSGSQDAKTLLDKVENAFNSGGSVVVQAALSREAVEKTDRLAEEMGLTKDLARQRIADNIGVLAKIILQRFDNVTTAVFGGDTLTAVMRHIGAGGIMPLAEIERGVVLSEAVRGNGSIFMITKSGGFGGEDVIVKISEYIGRDMASL